MIFAGGVLVFLGFLFLFMTVPLELCERYDNINIHFSVKESKDSLVTLTTLLQYTRSESQYFGRCRSTIKKNPSIHSSGC